MKIYYSKLAQALFYVVLITSTVVAQPPKRELRGAWIATFSNIDWPNRSHSAAQQQTELQNRLNEHRNSGMNAIFLQVRSQCDALYNSPYEPWTADLTGTQGKDPGYDPLAFAIAQAHQRGMELHAWFNPYRALSSATTTNLNNLADSHLIRTQPLWIMNVTTNSNGAQQRLLNPGLAPVRAHIVKVVMDVVRRYDVDGIHFDDSFYTTPATTTYNDDSAYNLPGNNPAGLAKADWRRANVDSLIKQLGDSIRAAKPWVKFGISPSGIYLRANNPNTNGGSTTSAGALQHYKDLFANSLLWQQQGWVDYLAPQVYWHMNQTGSAYSILANWWSQRAANRHVYIGQAGYKVGDAAQGAFNTNTSEVNDQVRLNRSLTGVQGQIVYNTTSLRNNKNGFTDSLRLYMHSRPALRPTMPWKPQQAPVAPEQLVALVQPGGQVLLSWQQPLPGSDGEAIAVWQYAIYRTTTAGPIDINDASNLLALTTGPQTSYTDATALPGQDYAYVVTALNRLHNESSPSNQAGTGSLPLQLTDFNAAPQGQYTLVQWQTAQEQGLLYFEVEASPNGSQYQSVHTQPARNLAMPQQYSLTVPARPGATWYRLRTTEADGRISYSKAVVVWHAAARQATVYPTTTSAGQQLTLTWAQPAPATYRLVQANGAVVLQGRLAAAQQQSILLPTRLAAGLYYLQLSQQATPTVVPILVQ